MTEHFIRQMHASLKCRMCKREPEEGKRFCSPHLAYARKKWHEHRQRCQAQGRCIDCPRPPLKGEQRCLRCKKENQAYCKSWWRANAARLRRRWHDRRARGLCGGCGLRKAIRNHSQCSVCHPGGYRT